MIVTKLDGAIDFVSKPKRGSTFIYTVKLQSLVRAVKQTSINKIKPYQKISSQFDFGAL